MLIQKRDTDNIRKGNYRKISLMSIDAKIINKILENQINNSLKGFLSTSKRGLSQIFKTVSTFKNQLT